MGIVGGSAEQLAAPDILSFDSKHQDLRTAMQTP